MTGSFSLPEKEEFDYTMHLLLTRKQTNEVKSHPELYKKLDKKSPFDYVDLHKRPFYPLDFRVIRFAITESSYECIITNLPQEEFTMNVVIHQ